MIIVDLIAAFAIAALAGIGVGSGGLLVIYMVLVGGAEQLPAQGLNLAFFVFAAGASFFVHLKKGRIDFYILSLMIFFGVIGSLLGARFAMLINPAFLRKAFGAMLTVAGIYTFFARSSEKKLDV